MRSSRGPEILLKYFSIWGGVHEQARRGSDRYPQGQGFMAATRMKSAGNVELFIARLMVTFPSSSGWRRTSSVLRLNSGISSRKSTPLWAIEIWPGWGGLPPPTKPASLTEWWGVQNGRTAISDCPG